MPLTEALRLALQAIWSSKLRSFFTLLGIIVCVAFLVVVVAIIQGMNAYVRENITGALIGTNAFQVRRTPITSGLMDDDRCGRINKRPLDHGPGRRGGAARSARRAGGGASVGLADARSATVSYRNRLVGNVVVFGVTPPYQVVQDYRFAAGEPLADPDVRERRAVVVLGYDVADKLFGDPAHGGRPARFAWPGREVQVKGVIAKKGRVLGQSFDALRPAAVHHVRVDVRPAEDHGGLGQDGERRGDRRRDGPRRGGDAPGPPAAPGRAERLHRGQGRRAGGLLAEPHPPPLHRHSRRGRASGSSSAASSS